MHSCMPEVNIYLPLPDPLIEASDNKTQQYPPSFILSRLSLGTPKNLHWTVLLTVFTIACFINAPAMDRQSEVTVFAIRIIIRYCDLFDLAS